MLVASYEGASGNAWWTVATGMTSNFYTSSPLNAGVALGTATLLQAAAGASGAKTATLSIAKPGATHMLALKGSSGAATTLTINKPAGVVQNDVMIAAITVGPSTATITPPAGWGLVRRTDNATGTTNSLAVYKLLAGAAEPASYTWTLSSGHTGAAGGIQAFSGADPTIEVENGQNTASGTAHATPIVTTALASTMLVASHGIGAASTTWTPPAGMTEGIDAQGGTQAVEMSYVLQVAAGGSGAKSATSTGTGTGNAHILALRRVLGAFNAFETATAAGSVTGVIKTKISGTTVSLDIAALNAAKAASAPTFVGTVRVEVLDASNNTGVLDPTTNCNSTWTTIQTLSDLTFAAADNGRKNTSFTVANSYPNARLRMTSPAGAPTITACSSDNFALRPNQFINVLVTDTDAQTAGTTRDLDNLDAPAGTVHKAGRPFTVRATAVNGAGSPVTTTNYAGTATTTLTDCGATNACLAGGFGTLAVGGSFVAGQLTSNLATYDEVGSVAVTLVDSTFANVDAGDGSSPAEREIKSSAVNVGRFVPDHFAVAYNGPTFGTACGAGSFTYVGQGFNYSLAPVITVTAQNFANTTTLNYTGALWQITNTSLTGKAYTAASGTVDATGLTGTDPAIVDSGLGVGTLTFRSPSFFAAGTGFFFTRTTPVAPFNAEVSLAINVIDADGAAYASNPARFGQASTGNGIAFSAGKSMRFGRLALRNANGSQLSPLAVPMETQYWGYTNAPTNTVLGFISNTADSCTSLANNNVEMSGFTSHLSACETAVNGAGTLSAGRRSLLLAAPGSANDGSVQLTVNLGASNSGTTCTSVGAGTVSAAGASRSYLQGNWTGAAYDQNPKARAAFGTFKGAEEVIFMRENF
jgi:MSHA biogenesis protein MshQ